MREDGDLRGSFVIVLDFDGKIVFVLCAALFPWFDFIPGLRCGSGLHESANLVRIASDLHRYVLVIYLLGLWFSGSFSGT
jgi:hypothetical protein